MADSDDEPRVEWHGQLTFERRVGDRRLTVVAQPFNKRSSNSLRYAGISVEAPAEAESLSEILANHGHADIGDYATIIECIVACELYIQRWVAGKVRELACKCADIEIKETASKRMRLRFLGSDNILLGSSALECLRYHCHGDHHPCIHSDEAQRGDIDGVMKRLCDEFALDFTIDVSYASLPTLEERSAAFVKALLDCGLLMDASTQVGAVTA